MIPYRPVSWRRLVDHGLPVIAMAVLLGLSVLAVVQVAGGGAVATGADATSLPALRLTPAATTGAIALPEAAGDTRSRRILLVPRDPVDAIDLTVAGRRGQPLHFYRPHGEGVLPVAYLFALPETGGAPLQLHASGRLPVALAARIMSEREALGWSQRVVALNVIAYTGVFCLALLAAALLWTLREHHFGYLFLAALAVGLQFAAWNGHLYVLPGLRWWGVFAERGLWSLSLLADAALLALVAQIGGPRGEREWRRLGFVLAALAGLALALLPAVGLPVMAGQVLVEGASLVIGALALALLARAARAHAPMAIPALVVLAVALAATVVRALLGHGLVADTAWSRYGHQLAILGLLVVLALHLIVRIGAYREQRDLERDARLDSERRAQREAGRAALARALQARLRDLAPADVEWTAFRLMLEHLLPHVPARVAAVVAYGYHGRDVVVTDPIEDRSLVEDLQGTRLLMLKRQSLTGRPWQHAVSVEGRRRYEALVPLQVDPQGWGALLLQREGDGDFDNEELATALEFVRLTLLHANEAISTQVLRRTAEVDPLTGAMNRRSIDQWLARHARQGAPVLSLLFVDIDHFKSVNDLHGHACGDHCLRNVAIALRSALAPQHPFGRYGGEEFIALLPDCELSAARAIAERMRVAVEQAELEWQGKRMRLSVSIGIATRAADETAASLVDRADRALYVAKREGRNRVSVGPAVFSG